MELVQNPKAVKAWTFYDWANSVYSLVISTAIFPIYYNAVTTSESNGDQVTFLGSTFTNTALYDYCMAASFLFIALISPVLSGLADYSGRKKSFLRRFCYVGAIACASLFFFTDDSMIWLALLAVMIASVGFWGSQVFYNAYLPELAPKNQQDSISAKGYAFGYLGSSILLILCLVLIEGHEIFGIADKGFATRVSFLLVGIWWAGFAQVTFKHLPEPPERKSIHWRTLTNGYKELRHFWISLQHDKKLKVYLFAYFFFSTGVQTVILLASVFGSKELGISTTGLIVTILLIQFVGIGGAYLFSYLTKQLGNINALIVAVVIWILICLAAFVMSKETPNIEYYFYGLGAVVGLVLGGIQSQARSTYSKMLPESGEHTTFFSFYDVSEKLAIALGMFAFGFIEELTGSMQYSALSLAIFFLISLFFLAQTKKLWKASNY